MIDRREIGFVRGEDLDDLGKMVGVTRRTVTTFEPILGRYRHAMAERLWIEPDDAYRARIADQVNGMAAP